MMYRQNSEDSSASYCRGKYITRRGEDGRRTSLQQRSSAYIPPPPNEGTSFDPYYFRRKYVEDESNYNSGRSTEKTINVPQRNPSVYQRLPTIHPSCTFCDEENPEFANKQRMKKHFADYCPMLHKCRFCDRAIEVSKLNDHYLSKCPWLENSLKPCDRCGQAVTEEEETKHEKEGNCHAVTPVEGHRCCPLCFHQVLDSDSAWQQHLIGSQGCYGNLRRSTYGCGPREEIKTKHCQPNDLKIKKRTTLPSLVEHTTDSPKRKESKEKWSKAFERAKLEAEQHEAAHKN